MHPHRRTFVELCAELTGYDVGDLEGTGLVDDHLALLEQQVGAPFVATLLEVARRVLAAAPGRDRTHAIQIDLVASPTFWPLLTSLVQLWYLGSFTSMSVGWYKQAGVTLPKHVKAGTSFVPSMEAYVQQLAYRAAGAHPPGANPTGHGSWSIPPVFGDVRAQPSHQGTRGKP